MAIALRRSEGDSRAASLIEQVANDLHTPLATWAAAVDDLRSYRHAPAGTTRPDDGSPESLVELTRHVYLSGENYADGGQELGEATRQLASNWRNALRPQPESGAP
jgi:hypothetical protein